jgi:uncharacterized membrane protein YhiD involved in acid resistance
MDELLNALGSAGEIAAPQLLLSLVFSLLMGSAIGAAYRRTHAGFSYSRSFVQTLVLACLVATIMIIAIGNNLARGLGILGALAIIRFRTPIRDPRDIIFLFATLAIGIASGAQLYGVALLGTAFFIASAFYLNVAPFSSQREFEGLLRYVQESGAGGTEGIDRVLSEFASSVDLVSAREALQGDALEYAYQVRLIDPSYRDELLQNLRRVPGVSDVSFLMRRTTVEL